MEDASLDDFLDDSEESDHEDTDSEDREDSDHEDDDSEDTDIEQPTSRWLPDGRDCAVCETTVTRLWRDEGRLVCAACKSWG